MTLLLPVWCAGRSGFVLHLFLDIFGYVWWPDDESAALGCDAEAKIVLARGVLWRRSLALGTVQLVLRLCDL